MRETIAVRRQAPHAWRLLAWLVDLLLVLVLVAGLPEPFPLIAPIALFVGYHAVAVWLTGRTIGKAVFGLRVERGSRSRTAAWSLGRATIGYFGCSLFGLGYLVALRDQRHRAVHDIVFESEVVVVDGGKLNVRIALMRLRDFARMREEAAKKRHAAHGLAVVGALWSWLRSLADGLVHGLDWLSSLFGGSGSGGGTSPLAAWGATAKAGLAAVATAVSAAVVAVVPPVADGADWLFHPRYYFSGPVEVARSGTPEAAIADFAREHGWPERGWNYEGDCTDAVAGEPRRLVCSAPVHGALDSRLAPGERAYIVGWGWSDVDLAFLALRRSGERWTVTRELTG
jgi:hypothetical protein